MSAPIAASRVSLLVPPTTMGDFGQSAMLARSPLPPITGPVRGPAARIACHRAEGEGCRRPFASEERGLAVAFFDCDLTYDQVARPDTDDVAAAWGREHEAELSALREKLLDLDRQLADLANDFGIEN